MGIIKLSLLEYFFILIPFFKPYLFIQFIWINNIFNIMQIVCGILIVLKFILKREKISNNFFKIIIIELSIIVITFINDGEVFLEIKEAIQILCLICFIDSEIKRDSKTLLKVLLFIFKLLIYTNFLTQLVNPEGFLIGYRKIWFLGNKNSFISYILLAVLFEYINLYNRDFKYKFGDSCFFAISILSIFLSKSATGIIGLIGIMLYIILPNIFMKSFLGIKSYIVVYVILFFNIIIFNVQGFISQFFSNIFHKKTDFSGRVDIWQLSMNFIHKKPILGYGYQTENTRTKLFGNWEIVHCHNMILDILYQGGTILLIEFLLYLKMIINKLNRCKDLFMKNFLEWYIFIFFIVLLTEVYAFDKIFIAFTIIYNIDYFIKNEKEEINVKN